MVEQYFRKVEVGGSNPPGGSKRLRLLTESFVCQRKKRPRGSRDTSRVSDVSADALGRAEVEPQLVRQESQGLPELVRGLDHRLEGRVRGSPLERVLVDADGDVVVAIDLDDHPVKAPRAPSRHGDSYGPVGAHAHRAVVRASVNGCATVRVDDDVVWERGVALVPHLKFLSHGLDRTPELEGLCGELGTEHTDPFRVCLSDWHPASCENRTRQNNQKDRFCQSVFVLFRYFFIHRFFKNGRDCVER